MPESILIFIAGALVGLVTTNLIWIRGAVFGSLKIDQSSPEKDLYSLNIDNLDNLLKNKKVILKTKITESQN